MLRLLFFPILLPFYLLGFALRLALALVLLPIVGLVVLALLAATFIGGFALSLVVLAPLLPFVIAGAILFGLLKLIASPARSIV